MEWWDDLTAGLSEFASDNDRLSATLGQAGAAISPQGSWQQGLGNAAAGMGRANLKAKAAEKDKKARNQQLMQLIQALAGEGSGAFSQKDVAGPTKMTVSDKGVTLDITPDTGAGPLAENTPTPGSEPTKGGSRAVDDYSFLGGGDAQVNLTDLIPF